MSNLEELRSVVRQIKTLWHRYHHHPELPGLRAREKELRRALGLRWNEPIPGGERRGTMNKYEELQDVVSRIKRLWSIDRNHPELRALRARERKLRGDLGMRWNDPVVPRKTGARQGTTLSNYDRRCIREFGCTREEMDRQVRAFTGSPYKDRD